jgi:hypothetical protein
MIRPVAAIQLPPVSQPVDAENRVTSRDLGGCI